MDETGLYEKLKDGTLKPLKIPPHIAKSATIYLWLKGQALTLEEIQFILTSPEIK